MGIVNGPATVEGRGLKMDSMMDSVDVGAKKAGGVVELLVPPRTGEEVLDLWLLAGVGGLRGLVCLGLRGLRRGRVRLEDPLMEEEEQMEAEGRRGEEKEGVVLPGVVVEEQKETEDEEALALSRAALGVRREVRFWEEFRVEGGWEEEGVCCWKERERKATGRGTSGSVRAGEDGTKLLTFEAREIVERAGEAGDAWTERTRNERGRSRQSCRSNERKKATRGEDANRTRTHHLPSVSYGSPPNSPTQHQQPDLSRPVS